MLSTGGTNPRWSESLNGSGVRWGGSGSSRAASSQELQQEAEQVDDVQVEAEGGENVFLRTYGVALVP